MCKNFGEICPRSGSGEGDGEYYWVMCCWVCKIRVGVYINTGHFRFVHTFVRDISGLSRNNMGWGGGPIFGLSRNNMGFLVCRGTTWGPIFDIRYTGWGGGVLGSWGSRVVG